MSAISVLMPVHNAAATIDAAVFSIATQQQVDPTLVLVDDGSTDDSVDRAAAAWRRGGRGAHRLRVVSQGHGGLVAALNAGLPACEGELLARMDADDVALPQRLRDQCHYLHTHPEVGVVGSQVENFGTVGRGIAHYVTWQNDLLDHDAMVRERFIESPLAHPSTAMRRQVMDDLDGYRDPPWAEDYDLWLRLAETPWRFAKLPQILLRWRDHQGRATRRDRRYIPDGFLRCKAHFLRRGPLAAGRVMIWGAGTMGCRLARYLEAEGCCIVAFIDVDARKIGGVRRGNVPVIAPSDLQAWPTPRPPCVSCVGNRGARQHIRAALVDYGYIEGQTFWCAA